MKKIINRRSAIKTISKVAALSFGFPYINRGSFQLFASSTDRYSAKVIELVTENLVIDMLGLLSLNGETRKRWGPDGKVVKPIENALSQTGGLIVLKGNLCPDGALLKIAGLKKLDHEGPAMVFESEEACMEIIREKK